MKSKPAPFAREDGFYAEYFTRDESADLARTRPDLIDEICLARVIIRRLAEPLDQVETYSDDNLKRLATMTGLFRATGILMSYQSKLDGPRSEHDRAIDAAMRPLRENWRMA